jgi:hypothetical protein
MPRSSKTPEKPRPSDDAWEALRDALLDIESLPGYDLSEADVTCDNLASALVDAFFLGKKNPFRGRAPALYEVVEQMEETFGVSDDAVDAAYKIKELIEDAYGEDEDDSIGEEVKEWADALVAELEKFFKTIE